MDGIGFKESVDAFLLSCFDPMGSWSPRESVNPVKSYVCFTDVFKIGTVGVTDVKHPFDSPTKVRVQWIEFLLKTKR